jgi:hypothetical protein
MNAWVPAQRKTVSPRHAQGIAAEIPEQTAKRFVRNWSGKPGPAAGRMRPNSSVQSWGAVYPEGGRRSAKKFKNTHSLAFALMVA